MLVITRGKPEFSHFRVLIGVSVSFRVAVTVRFVFRVCLELRQGLGMGLRLW